MICEFCGNFNNGNRAGGRPKCCGAITAGAMTGRTIGSFRILGELGRGNRGVVYLARQISLDRLVALKLLAEELKDQQSAREEFFTEAKLAAKLDFPNTVSPVEAGEADGLCYFAMEFVRGENVEDRLGREKQLPFDDIRRIALAVADALDCAWEKCRMIHGDIKPANILLPADDSAIKLADFGLASIGESNGVAQGTPLYAAPELICPEMGERDCRADIYSLGVMLYELSAGKAPFSGDPSVILENHLHLIPTPLHRLAPDFPEEFTGLVDRMLRKSHTERPQSWSEVAGTLRAIGEPALQAKPPRRPWTAVLTASLAALAIGLAAGYFLTGSGKKAEKAPPPSTQATISPPQPETVPAAPLFATATEVKEKKEEKAEQPVQEVKAKPTPPPPPALKESPPEIPKQTQMPAPRRRPQFRLPTREAKAPEVAETPPAPPKKPPETQPVQQKKSPETQPKPAVQPGADYFQAAKAGNITLIRQKLADGVEINAADANGYTALMLASFREHEPLVRYLLSQGADRTIRNQYNQTAADLAPDRSEVKRLLNE